MQGFHNRTRLSSWCLAASIVVFLVIPTTQAQEKEFNDTWTPEHIGNPWMSPYYFTQQGGGGMMVDGKATLVGFEYCANRDGSTTPLPKAYSHRYWFTYPRLHQGDLIPFCGALYTVGTIKTQSPGNRINLATRLSETDIPKGTQLHEDKYVFSLQTPKDAQYWSGRLQKCFIYFWEIAPTKDDPQVMTAKVGVLAGTEEVALGYDKKIVWKWYRVGDAIDFGGVRHKLSAIVPPKEPKKLGRGEARMIGWIELDPEPLKEEPAKE